MRNRVLALSFLLALLCALPVFAGTFWHDGNKQIKRSAGSTEAPAADGWVRITPEQYAPVSGVEPRYIKSVGGLPAEMDAGEKAAVDLVRTRATARGRMLSAVSDLIAAQEMKSRLNAAGKSEVLIDIRISGLEATIATAIGNHPDA